MDTIRAAQSFKTLGYKISQSSASKIMPALIQRFDDIFFCRTFSQKLRPICCIFCFHSPTRQHPSAVPPHGLLLLRLGCLFCFFNQKLRIGSNCLLTNDKSFSSSIDLCLEFLLNVSWLLVSAVRNFSNGGPMFTMGAWPFIHPLALSNRPALWPFSRTSEGEIQSFSFFFFQRPKFPTFFNTFHCLLLYFFSRFHDGRMESDVFSSTPPSIMVARNSLLVSGEKIAVIRCSERDSG